MARFLKNKMALSRIQKLDRRIKIYTQEEHAKIILDLKVLHAHPTSTFKTIPSDETGASYASVFNEKLK